MSDQPPPPPPPGPGADQPPGPGYWKASDGNWYPPEQRPQEQPYPFNQMQPAPAQSGGMPGWAKGCLIAAAVVGVLAILAVACVAVVVDEAAEEIDRQTGVAADDDFDIDLEECIVDDFDTPKASGTITNTSDERQGFQVDVRFTDPEGTLIEESPTFVDAIDPGETARWSTISLEDPQADSVNCALEVSYTIFD